MIFPKVTYPIHLDQTEDGLKSDKLITPNWLHMYPYKTCFTRRIFSSGTDCAECGDQQDNIVHLPSSGPIK